MNALLQRWLHSSDADLPQEPQERQRIAGNALALIGSTFLTKTADSLASPKITLTWLLQSVGASSAAISLLVPIRESGALLPQAALATLANRRRRQKGLYNIGLFIQGGAAAGMLASVLWLDGVVAGWAVVACLAVLSLARCLCSLTFKSMLGKSIPKGLRGQTTGWSASAAGFSTCLVALMLILLPVEQKMQPLLWMLAIAALAWWLASALIAGLDEPEQTPDTENNALMHRLSLLREDRAFLQFVIARALLTSTALVAPYYVMLQADAESLLSDFGALLLASGVASLIASPIWGRQADQSSRRTLVFSALLVTGLGLATVALYLLAPALFDTIWLVPLIYFCLELAHQGVRVGRKTYVVDMADDDQRVDYVSVSNTAIGAVLLLLGVVTSLLSIWLPPIALIGVLALFSACGAWMGRRMPDVE